jgi:hypothetical protein
MSILNTFPKPADYLNEFWLVLVGANLPQILHGLGWLLLLVGIIWGGIRVATLGTGEITGLAFRYMIATILLVASYSISGDIRRSWIQAQDWSYNAFAKKTVDEAGEKLATMGVQGGLAVLEVGVQVATLGAGVELSIAKAGGQSLVKAANKAAIGAVQEAAPEAALGIANAAQAMMFLAVPIVTAYYVIVIVSGFGLLVASIMLPIAAALLILPSGSDWSFRWAQGIVTSLLIVTLAPLVFATALKVGFIGPADEFQKTLEQTTQDVQDTNKDADNDWKNGNGLGWAGNYVKGRFQEFVVSPWKTAFAFIWALLMIVISMGAAIAIINGAVNQITQYVGGAASSGAGSGAGAFALSFAASKALSGASRAMKGSGPKTGSPNGPSSPDVKPPSPKGPSSPDSPRLSGGPGTPHSGVGRSGSSTPGSGPTGGAGGLGYAGAGSTGSTGGSSGNSNSSRGPGSSDGGSGQTTRMSRDEAREARKGAIDVKAT